MPCYSSTSSSVTSYYLAPLSNAQAVVYVSYYDSFSNHLKSAFYKLNVKVCLQNDFNFVKHRQLSSHIKQLNTNNVLDAISSQSNYNGVSFSVQEADSIRSFLISSPYSPSSIRKNVLQNISIFSSASKSSEALYSVNTAKSTSVAKQVIGEPENCSFDIAHLPSELVILSRAEHNQLQLLKSLSVPFVTDAALLVNHVFPLINSGRLSGHVIDRLMPEILDSFHALTSRDSRMASHLQNLKFVKTVNGRTSPCELFTPLDEDIKALYAGEDVFPTIPYDTNEKVYTLQACGLRNNVTPQQILDIIYSISCSRSLHPQQVNEVKLSRAKAVLQYISTHSFIRQTGGNYVIANGTYHSTFSNALTYLATKWSWLPIESARPPSYPAEISWQGNALDSHFTSLSSCIVVSHSTASTLSCLVGSQSYIASPCVSDQIAAMLPSDSGSTSQLVVAHFKEILANHHLLSGDVLNSLVLQVYTYMNGQGATYLRLLYSIPMDLHQERE